MTSIVILSVTETLRPLSVCLTGRQGLGKNTPFVAIVNPCSHIFSIYL